MPMRRISGVSAVAIAALLALVGCSNKKAQEDHPSLYDKVTTKDIKVGEGPKAEEGDIILVQYEGTLAKTGAVFDTNDPKSSTAKNKNPLSIPLGGQSGVILGLRDGVMGMQKGGERKVMIPWKQAYGAVGSEGVIPPYADLIFDVKALHIVKKDELNTVEVDDLTTGSGPEVKAGDTVTVTYSGKFVNGREFDNTPTPDHKLSFRVGREEVISGIDKGILGMKAGGVRVITLPPAAGFGALGSGVIGGNQVLVYTVTLHSIKPGQ